MTYRTFTISDNVHGLKKIYRNGKQVFTARHQECWTVETAKQLIDDSLAMKAQQTEAGKSESQRLHEAWYKKAILFIENDEV
jgi:hypothetical protein